MDPKVINIKQTVSLGKHVQWFSIHRHTRDVINVYLHGLHEQKIAKDCDKKETINRSYKMSQAVNHRISA